MTIELDKPKAPMTDRQALLKVWGLMYPDGEPFDSPDEVPAHVEQFMKAQKRELESLTYNVAVAGQGKVEGTDFEEVPEGQVENPPVPEVPAAPKKPRKPRKKKQ